MINFDELRKTVAIQHNVLLGPHDPILVTITLNDLVLGRYVEVLTAQNEGHQKALAAALQEQVEQAKATAGRVITDAADYVSAQARLAVTAALTEARDQLRNDFAEACAASQEAKAETQAARAARTTAIAASVISALCALVALAAVLLR